MSGGRSGSGRKNGPETSRSKYWWIVPVAVVVAVGALAYAIIVSVANGTFL